MLCIDLTWYFDAVLILYFQWIDISSPEVNRAFCSSSKSFLLTPFSFLLSLLFFSFVAFKDWDGDFPVGAVHRETHEVSLAFRVSGPVLLHGVVLFHGCKSPAHASCYAYVDSQPTSEMSALRCEASIRLSPADIDEARMTSQLSLTPAVRVLPGEVCTLVTSIRGRTLQLTRTCDSKIKASEGWAELCAQFLTFEGESMTSTDIKTSRQKHLCPSRRHSKSGDDRAKE